MPFDKKNKTLLYFSDIINAQSVLKNIVKFTPLERSKSFSTMSETDVYLKLENFQTTGSFKVRGAYYKIKNLTPEEASKGVLCASAGNHAQGVAYAASSLGVKSTVFMPVFAPPLKVIATRAYGAKVVLIGDTFDDAFNAAVEFGKKSGATFVHPFNDPYIIAGQGTIGLEIFEQLREVEDVVVPIGGGGLIAGIAVKSSGKFNFDVTRKLVDELVVVSDAEMARTAYLLLQRAKILTEPAGVAAMAAVLYQKTSTKGRKVVPIISGGNANMSILDQIIDKGVMDEGLRARIQVLIPDQAGKLRAVITILDKMKASIHDIEHERSTTSVPVGHVQVTITFNLQDTTQLSTICKELEKQGMQHEVLR